MQQNKRYQYRSDLLGKLSEVLIKKLDNLVYSLVDEIDHLKIVKIQGECKALERLIYRELPDFDTIQSKGEVGSESDITII